MSLLKMLRQFHYIDKNGKDQGVNVRNRSQELVKLLSDVDQIRAERKKARANRHKFGGFEGGSGFGPGFSSSGRMVASAAIPPVTVVIAVACSAMVVVLVVILWIMVMLLSLDEAHGSRSTMRATM